MAHPTAAIVDRALARSPEGNDSDVTIYSTMKVTVAVRESSHALERSGGHSMMLTTFIVMRRMEAALLVTQAKSTSKTFLLEEDHVLPSGVDVVDSSGLARRSVEACVPEGAAHHAGRGLPEPAPARPDHPTLSGDEPAFLIPSHVMEFAHDGTALEEVGEEAGCPSSPQSGAQQT